MTHTIAFSSFLRREMRTNEVEKNTVCRNQGNLKTFIYFGIFDTCCIDEEGEIKYYTYVLCALIYNLYIKYKLHIYIYITDIWYTAIKILFK